MLLDLYSDQNQDLDIYWNQNLVQDPDKDWDRHQDLDLDLDIGTAVFRIFFIDLS